MKKILTGVAVFAAMTTGALAQTATQDITISATVPLFCTIAGGTSPAALTTSIPVSATGVVTTTQQTFTVASVVCNAKANVTATSLNGGVKSATAAATGFTNIIDYTGVATFASAQSTINTVTAPAAAGNEAGNTAQTTGAATGNLVITIDPAQPSSPLMAATDYSDTLRVTLTATL